MNKGTAIVGFILSFIAGMILVWGLGRGPGAAATKDEAHGAAAAPGATANPGAVKVELFVMSQCPYGVQAEALFEDVVKKLGNDVDFRLEFVGQKLPDGSLKSMHGANELKGNIIQACAMKYGARDKAYDMILCQNKNYKEVATNWEACAQQAGLPVDKIATCANGQEGNDLMVASFDRANAKDEQGQPVATGSPTIRINGKKYAGNRKSNDIFRAVCAEFQGKQPEACASIPESPKVNVTLLTDKRCKDCDTKRMEGSIKQKISNPVITTVDYTDPAGKKIFDAVKPVNLPAIVFDATLDKDKDAMMAFSRGLKTAGDYKVAPQGAWNPQCADDGGCNLDECKASLQCRVEEPKKLELFVMSQCPYGVKGFDAMKEVLENFKKNGEQINFQVHYIPQGEPAELKAMHGQGEVDENIRELCAIKHYPTDYKFMDYVWCRNKNIKDANYAACTTAETGIDADKIKTCFEGQEGKDLLLKSYEYTKASGFGASPTWLTNNKYKFSGIDAETIKTNFCQYNKIAGCDTKLSGPPPRPQGAAAKAEPGCGG